MHGYSGNFLPINLETFFCCSFGTAKLLVSFPDNEGNRSSKVFELQKTYSYLQVYLGFWSKNLQEDLVMGGEQGALFTYVSVYYSNLK